MAACTSALGVFFASVVFVTRRELPGSVNPVLFDLLFGLPSLCRKVRGKSEGRRLVGADVGEGCGDKWAGRARWLPQRADRSRNVGGRLVAASGKPVALIYRSRLLASSETFILEQARAMRTYRAYFAGVHRIKGLDVPADSLWVSEEGHRWKGFNKLRFKLTGPSRDELKELRLQQPKIVHAHFGPDASEALSLAEGLNIPLIATYHGYDATTFDGSLTKSRHGWLYLMRRNALRKRAAYFIAVSTFIRDKLLQQGFPADRTLIHHIGIDTNFFRSDPTVKRQPIVLFVGRLVNKKGCSLLIRAMQRVQEQVPDVQLVVVGDGHLKQQLEADSKATLKSYSFVGVRDSLEVRSWMQRATVFCVPSITAPDGDAEGFGMVFAEAQACGLPVVSFASGGIPDAVAHRETGLLAPEGNWQLLAEYLCLLLTDQRRWTEFSLGGQARVQRNFNIRIQTPILEDLYTQLIAEWNV